MKNQGLTVKDLIEVLQRLPQNADVLTKDYNGCAWIYGAYVDGDGDVIIDDRAR